MGVAVPLNVVISNPGGTSTTLAVTVASHQEDDVLKIALAWKGVQNPTTPAGWTSYGISTTGNATSGLGMVVYWRRVNPSETVSNPTITIGGTAVERLAVSWVERGADIDNPGDTFWIRQQTVGNSATPTPPTITTLAPNNLIIEIVAARGNTAITEPSGYTEIADAAVGSTLALAVSHKTQATAATLSGQSASITSNRWVAAIIAVPSPDYVYFRSQTSQLTTGASINGAIPTGTTDADFYGRADGMLAIVKAVGSGIGITPTDAVNWVNVANWDLDTSTGSDSVEVFATKYASGRSMVFNQTGSGGITLQLITYRNVHQTAFIGNSSAKTQTGTPSTFDAQSRQNTKSTVTSIIVTDADTNNTHTAPSGFTERSDGSGTGSADRIYEDGGATPSGSWTTTNAANVVGLIELLSHAGVTAQVQAPRTMMMARRRRT